MRAGHRGEGDYEWDCLGRGLDGQRRADSGVGTCKGGLRPQRLFAPRWSRARSLRVRPQLTAQDGRGQGQNQPFCAVFLDWSRRSYLPGEAGKSLAQGVDGGCRRLWFEALTSSRHHGIARKTRTG